MPKTKFIHYLLSIILYDNFEYIILIYSITLIEVTIRKSTI